MTENIWWHDLFSPFSLLVLHYTRVIYWEGFYGRLMISSGFKAWTMTNMIPFQRITVDSIILLFEVRGYT